MQGTDESETLPHPIDHEEPVGDTEAYRQPVAQEPFPNPDWRDIVERIKRGDSSGMTELYRVFDKGVRFMLYHRLGTRDLDDQVHDIFLIVIQAIQRDHLREPERLMGFVRTVVLRQVANQIDQRVRNRRREADNEEIVHIPDQRYNPEQYANVRQRAELMTEVLEGLSERDREILTRFYVEEQTQFEICKAMNLTETQFRVFKSRALTRFGENGQHKLKRKRMSVITTMRRSVKSRRGGDSPGTMSAYPDTDVKAFANCAR